MSPQGHAKRRVSSLHEASRLLAQLVTLGLRTIAFVRTRAVAERLYEATCDLLEPTKRAVLGVYRAGYLKEKRREIEGDLFGGRLTAVVATTALELGVDVGSLDATLHLGYPGSTASMAQQAGRAGRGGRDALAILIAGDNPLEQELMRNPRRMLQRPLERTVLDPFNEAILRQHLVAAAHELPLRMPPLTTALAAVAAQRPVVLAAGQGAAAAQGVVGRDASAAEEEISEEEIVVKIDDGDGEQRETLGAEGIGGDTGRLGAEEIGAACIWEGRSACNHRETLGAEEIGAGIGGAAAPTEEAAAMAAAAAAAAAAAEAACCAPCEEPEPHLGLWALWRGAAQAALEARQLREDGDHLVLPEGRVPGAVSLRDIDSRRVRLVVIPRPPQVGPSAFGESVAASGSLSGSGTGCGNGSGGAKDGSSSGGSGSGRSRRGGGGGGGGGGTPSWLLEKPAEMELETMEESAAQLRVYDQAVYLHAGASYVVHRLDLEEQRAAFLYREDVNYYTEPRDHGMVAVQRRVGEVDGFGGRCRGYHGHMRVSKEVYGYRKCAKVGGRVLKLELCDADCMLIAC